VLRKQGVGAPVSAVIIYRCSDYTVLYVIIPLNNIPINNIYLKSSWFFNKGFKNNKESHRLKGTKIGRVYILREELINYLRYIRQ
jgi:hypothetical protein